MSIDKFQNKELVLLEYEGNLSSFALVLVEHSLCQRKRMNRSQDFPEVRGCIFEWGIIKEYGIDDLYIWHFHFLQLLEEIEILGMSADDMVMTCLAFFDRDCWPDGRSFWGGKTRIWPHGNSIWQIGGQRPDIQICRYEVPIFIEICHGTETDSLSIECCIENELLARDWIGNIFLPKILNEMLHQVEKSLIRYSKE